MESKQSKMLNRSKNICNKVIEELETQITTSQENLNIGLQKRRHAINITSNPSYQVIINNLFHSNIFNDYNFYYFINFFTGTS